MLKNEVYSTTKGNTEKTTLPYGPLQYAANGAANVLNASTPAKFTRHRRRESHRPRKSHKHHPTMKKNVPITFTSSFLLWIFLETSKC